MTINMTRCRLVTLSRRYFLYLCVVATIFVFVLTSVNIVPSRRYTVQYEDTIYENPSIYLQSRRFDVIVKIVYAYFYVHKGELPDVIRDAYLDHLRVWNHFKEHCSSIKKDWFDGKIPCKNKRNQSDFILSFHKTIELIKERGFNSSISKIPLDNNGFLMNGAHRISAAVVLSKNVSFEHHHYKQNAYHWDYKFFRRRGMAHDRLNMVVLEWMKIQTTLPSLKKFVSVVSVFSSNSKKDKNMRNIVKHQCSMDSSILYEVGINFTRTGIQQLVTHMYGQQPWIHTKIEEMLSKTKSTYRGEFFFVFAQGAKQLVKCKNQIRKLYNDKIYNSTVHIPDSIEANLILAEMILNPNSIQFMNYAKNPLGCSLIANEIARRLTFYSIEWLPGIFVGRVDVMIDSSAVLGIFGIRKQVDFDLLFLYDNIKELLRKKHGIEFRTRSLYNPVSYTRAESAMNEDFLSKNETRKRLNLFYDPRNFGFCYGIKFISLKLLLRHKRRRNGIKDVEDVKLIHEF